MTSASLRFFTFELGKNDFKKLNQYFKLTLFLYLGFGITVLVLSESVGIWFVQKQMVIPANRMNAAIWIYHLSIASFIVNMFVVPYNSIIIAHEKMDIFAFISIAEALLKLTIVYVLVVLDVDKLKVYGVLLFLVTLIISTFYIVYSSIRYKECKISLFWNTQMFKELMSYSGWSLFGALADMIRNQGINIILNVFFNPIVNAARAIAFQINNSINLFVTNFFQAVRPQITKQYAADQKEEMMKLVFSSSRFCYYMILVFSIPILLETPFILSIWLKEVPVYTILFTRLVIITTIIESISYPFMTAVSATGKIKWYQIMTGGLLIFNLPISYILLKIGYPPESTMYVAMVIAVISQISRILFMQSLHKMSIFRYLREIIIVLIVVTLLIFIAPYIIYINSTSSFARLINITLVTLVSSFFVIYLTGITHNERQTINNIIYQIKKKYFK